MVAIEKYVFENKGDNFIKRANGLSL